MSHDFYELAGFHIRRLHQISVSIFDQEMASAQVDLTQVQYAALSVLAACPGIDQATLAGLIAHDRVTIGGVVDRLVGKGLVDRHVNAQDRRARQLAITPSGRSLLEAASPIVRALQSAILAGLTPEEQRQFLALLVKTTTANNARSRAPLIRPEGA
jgi:DNA-binding MarR family transcriptional regulator